MVCVVRRGGLLCLWLWWAATGMPVLLGGRVGLLAELVQTEDTRLRLIGAVVGERYKNSLQCATRG